MKKLIKKIPLIGPLAIRWNNKRKVRKFNSSEEYWKERYSTGGTSGIGSYDKLAEYKGEIINEFVAENNIESAIEFSCGDGNQLGYFNFKKYKGYEISQAAVDKCIEMYKDDSSKTFFHYDDYLVEKADITMSLDVIYCLPEIEVYEQYLTKLFECSSKYVLVFSTNMEDDNPYATYIIHRKFTDWVDKNRPDFELVKYVKNKYHEEVKPFISDFYFYKLKD